MADATSDIDAYVKPYQPSIRRISPADLKEALSKGWDDFQEMPTFAIFLVAIYPIIGVVLFTVTFGYDMLPLVFPLIAGFALLGPLAAVGLYELSRRRELGQEASLGALSFVLSPSIGTILVLGVVLLAVFIAWLFAALAIYEAIFGPATQPVSMLDFASQVLTTSQGWTLIVVGCGVGFLFALAAFVISVVSFPMALDRKVGPLTAMTTSINAVLANPIPMAMWGLIVAASLLVGILPLFTGLIVVLPVLGHATWHLYRKLIV
jgi:uncharacterized membrane protein